MPSTTIWGISARWIRVECEPTDLHYTLYTIHDVIVDQLIHTSTSMVTIESQSKGLVKCHSNQNIIIIHLDRVQGIIKHAHLINHTSNIYHTWRFCFRCASMAAWKDRIVSNGRSRRFRVGLQRSGSAGLC